MNELRGMSHIHHQQPLHSRALTSPCPGFDLEIPSPTPHFGAAQNGSPFFHVQRGYSPGTEQPKAQKGIIVGVGVLSTLKG